MKKIENAMQVTKQVRKELNTSIAGVNKAMKKLATLQSSLMAAQKEFDTAVVKAESAVKAANSVAKQIAPIKKVPAVKKATTVRSSEPKRKPKVRPSSLKADLKTIASMPTKAAASSRATKKAAAVKAAPAKKAPAKKAAASKTVTKKAAKPQAAKSAE